MWQLLVNLAIAKCTLCNLSVIIISIQQMLRNSFLKSEILV
jgi:hypothetical protein